MKWVNGITLLLMVMVPGLIAGCGGGGDSSGEAETTAGEFSPDSTLLDNAVVKFFGETDWREFPVFGEQTREGTVLVVRRQPLQGATGEPGHLLQLYDVSGHEQWSRDLPGEGAYVLDNGDGSAWLLLRLREGAVLTGLRLQKFDLASGEFGESIEVPWNLEANAWFLHKFEDGRFLVSGATAAGGGVPFEPATALVNADGSPAGEWTSPATNLYPLEDGFFGAIRYPGGRMPDAELMRLDDNGEVVWRIENADSSLSAMVIDIVESEGDIVLTAMDRNQAQPVLARLDGKTGEYEWVKRHPELKRMNVVNPLRWGGDQFLAGGSQPRVDPRISQTPWNSPAVFTFNGKGDLLDLDLRDDFWMIPTTPLQQLGPERAIMIGIGSAQHSDFPQVSDTAWLGIGLEENMASN